MTVLGWLHGHMFGNPDLPRHWTFLTVFTLISQAVSWTAGPRLWAATPTGTTDPATVAAADPGVVALVAVGVATLAMALLVLDGTGSLRALRRRVQVALRRWRRSR